MPVPKVAIVGRPNVGKSSLFNWLAGRRIAIVDPSAGVTRDRLATLVQTDDRSFELIDTGGMGIQDVDNLTKEIERQIALAIDEAHLILFVVDTRDGITPLDKEVARRLRSISKPVLLVANKCDAPEMEPAAAEFHRLGHEPLIPVSALQNRNKEDLLRLIAERLPNEVEDATTPADVHLKLAIVGRRNTGKSTFINSLAQEERVIVSQVPGTTRDSIDVRFERDGKTFIAIDTAGIRKKRSVGTSIEFYGLHRAERSIRRADVVLLFFDAHDSISKVDKQLAEYILKHHKPAIFVINKWDLMRPMPTGKFADYVRATFPSLDFVPLAFITAKAGKNVHAVLNLAQHLHKQASARVNTSDLNRVLRQAIALQEPPLRQNRRPRIYFGTQVAANPPTIVLFTNGPELFDDTYQRYLLKTFRDHLPFAEVPIKLYLRMRRSEEATPEDKEPPARAAASKGRKRQRKRVPSPTERRSRVPVAKKKIPSRSRARQDSDVWRDV